MAMGFNPFRTGRGLSTYLLILNDVLLGFNPFEAGRGLSTYVGWAMCRKQACFNPFGAGQGLSTILDDIIDKLKKVSIPLEQGGVFRLKRCR